MDEIPSEQCAVVDAITQKLAIAGLVVTPRRWALGDFSLVISRPYDGDPNNEIQALKDTSWIYFEKDCWNLMKPLWTSEAELDDIHLQAKPIEYLLIVLLDCYFGEPIILNKWSVPVHRHPEWSVERLTEIIDAAQRASSEEWHLIRDNCKHLCNQLPRSATFSQVSSFQFITIAHSEDPYLTLYLRRDLAEAFIVSLQS